MALVRLSTGGVSCSVELENITEISFHWRHCTWDGCFQRHFPGRKFSHQFPKHQLVSFEGACETCEKPLQTLKIRISPRPRGTPRCEIQDRLTAAVSFLLIFPAHHLLNGEVMGTHSLLVAALGKLLSQTLRKAGT